MTTTSRGGYARVAIQYAAGVPNRRISAIEIAFVSSVTRSASFAASLPSAAISSPGGTRRKIATTGRRRNASATLVARASVAPEQHVYVDDFGTGRKPAFLSAVWPLADRIALIHACAAVLFVDLETTAIS